MKLSLAIIAAFAAASTVEATISNAIRRDDGSLVARHVRVGRRNNLTRVARANGTQKRCKPKSSAPAPNSASVDTKTPPPAPAPAQGAPSGGDQGNSQGQGSNNNPPPQQNQSPAPTNGLRVLQVNNGACGPNGASVDISPTTGPNGSQQWLNCGIDGAGWNPPFVKVSDIVAVDLRQSLQDPNSPYHACTAFIDQFESNANQHGLPPIILAAFAMQESGCRPDAVGGNGEQGLMQITQEKCGGAPNGDCREPGFNIGRGAQYFADRLNDNGGDLLKSIGNYNGWFPGMTTGAATAARAQGHCLAQQNLDYLMQTLNGWYQGRDGRSLGVIRNIDGC